MSDRHLRPLSALAGVANPGRFGKASGEPGVVIQERIGLGLATVAARKGQAAALKQAVISVYGVERGGQATGVVELLTSTIRR